MTKLTCMCGNVLSDSVDPSKDVLYVFSEKDFVSQIKKHPNLKFYEFYMFRDYEFWVCRRCKRIYFNREQEKKADKCFKLDKFHVVNQEDLIAESWNRIYIFSDLDLYDLIEENEEITLSDFFSERKNLSKTFISADQKIIAVLDPDSESIVRTYSLESSETSRRMPL